MFSIKTLVYFLLLILLGVSCKTDDSSENLIGSLNSTYELEFVLVPGGKFNMGNENGEKDEMPVHLVKVDSFCISKYEVTNGQYCKFLNSVDTYEYKEIPYIELDDQDCRIQYNRKGYYPEPGYTNHPVVEVTWYGAKAYSEWKGGRLPTEAEWEFAAKGGNHSKDYKYSGSNNPKEVAWYDENSQGRTHLVGSKTPNELGLYDMSGNVWEWCSDYYRGNYYDISPQNNPHGPRWSTAKVVRGGSWGYNESYLSPTFRKMNSPDAGNFNLGFRVVKDVP
jgi:formylglycine-generating enzyme required for sulfatase activity